MPHNAIRSLYMRLFLSFWVNAVYFGGQSWVGRFYCTDYTFERIGWSNLARYRTVQDIVLIGRLSGHLIYHEIAFCYDGVAHAVSHLKTGPSILLVNQIFVRIITHWTQHGTEGFLGLWWARGFSNLQRML